MDGGPIGFTCFVHELCHQIGSDQLPRRWQTAVGLTHAIITLECMKIRSLLARVPGQLFIQPDSSVSLLYLRNAAELKKINLLE